MNRSAILALCLALGAQAATQRFLLLASANDGGPGKIPLRYAQSDARGFGKVLASLGGVDSSDIVRLQEPDSAALLSGLHSLSEQVGASRARGLRTEVVFYYSGHADENGLMLGKERVEYKRLRLAMDSAGSDVRLAVLDACASGGALRAKGGVRRPAFLTDDSQDLRGRALLTSSTAQENSHESDSLGGSFFTQALLTGLRGAADADRDNKVTLNEAYRFAYQETLRRTQEARAGSQHPSVDMDLAGAGDVILTDLRSPSARLLLDTSLTGRLTVRDTAGSLVAELQKWPGMPVELGLEPGTYQATFLRGGRPYRDTLRLALGEMLLTDSMVGQWDTIPATGEPATTTPSPAKDTLRTIAMNLGIMPPMDMAGEDGIKMRQRFALELALAEAGEIDGWQLAGGMATSHGRMRGVQIAAGVVIADGDSAHGVQVATVAMAKGAMRGLQVSSVSVARGGITGAQVSYVANISGRGDFAGVQVGTFFNLADHGQGAQVGLVNWGGHFKGAQVGLVNGNLTDTGAQVGLVNLSGSAHGAQVGLVNLDGRHVGPQVGLVNLSKGNQGTSVGLVNLTFSQAGVQVGMVNVTDTLEGVQVGMVNLSRVTRGLPIGPLSWSASLPWRLDSWLDETGIPTLSSVWEWKWLHSQTDISSDLGQRNRPVFGYGWALGMQLPSQRWILSTDLGSKTLTRGTSHTVKVADGPDQRELYTNTMLRARLLAGAWLHPRVGLFAGAGWTLLSSNQAEDDLAYVGPRAVSSERITEGLQTWPSLFAGVRLNLRR